MNIERVIIRNYRSLKFADIKLNKNVNIIVGDNETGKSTLLEAINLALKCQINRRPAQYELHPFLFNVDEVASFVSDIKLRKPAEPPRILIELYLCEEDELAILSGSFNSLKADRPGISLAIELDPDFFAEYEEYVKTPDLVRTVPVEYYHVVWQDFASHYLNTRAVPIRSALTDPTSISNDYAANKYVLEIVRDYLSRKQRVDLALSYRKLKDLFLDESNVKAINKELATKKGTVSDKELSVSMDTTSRASWETGILPYLDNIPLTLVGKGEQNSIKIKLALDAASAADIFLIEEPENHLSHSNLNKLINHISQKLEGKQLIITTHSSFVLNKLGIDHVLLFNGKGAITLADLPPTTKEYFMKLPGHDTLRLILASRSILVEGPSDELIVQKAFVQLYSCMPLERGVEVISVNSLAFKRFLDIARLLNLDVDVVTDNDGNPDRVKERYAEYEDLNDVAIYFSDDANLKTLEPHLLKLNGRGKLNRIFNKQYENDESLLAYMESNKTTCALALFDSAEPIVVPDYIQYAVE